MKTLQQQLEEVQVAISKAEVSQSYGINGRSIQMANLETLYKREQFLKLQISRELNGGDISISYGVIV